MDDGSIQNKGLHLNTYSFSKEEVILLKNAIEKIFVPIELLASPKQEQEKFILKCSIHKHKKGYRIYIWEQGMDTVRNHISQYMHKDMLYKINSK